MSWFEPDYYNEPSEFDEMVEEFKESLAKSIKEEHQNEMKKLKEENKSLQAIKDEFEEIKRDYRIKLNKLESDRSNMIRELRRERLLDLLKDKEVNLYRAISNKVWREKCDKCDNNRRVKYFTPLGKEAVEDCTCKVSLNIYKPQELTRYEFKINRNRSEIVAWYRQYDDDEDGLVYDTSVKVEDVYSGEVAFKDIESKYYTFFKTEEECQEYCDYLNKKTNRKL